MFTRVDELYHTYAGGGRFTVRKIILRLEAYKLKQDYKFISTRTFVMSATTERNAILQAKVN